MVYKIGISGFKLKSADKSSIESLLSTEDCAVLFFGGYAEKGRRIDEETRRRVESAVKMYRAGIVKNLIFTGGGVRDNPGEGGAWLMNREAVKAGVKETDIFYDNTAGTTVDDIRAAVRIIGAGKFRGVLFVSSLMHIRSVKRHVKRKYLLSGYSFVRPYYFSYQNLGQYGVAYKSSNEYVDFHLLVIRYAYDTCLWMFDRLMWNVRLIRMKRGN